MEELPKIYNEEQPESQKRSKVAIAVMVLVLLAMPLGVFLTLRTQNPNSQASFSESRPPETSIIVASRNPSVNNQSVFPVDVIIHSDQKASNLFATRLTFIPDTLEVVSIASSSADLTDEKRIYPATEWIDSSYNNEQGIINLVAGVPQQGLKTNPSDEKDYILATIFFKAKKGALDTEVLLQEGSVILSHENGSNLLSKAQSLTFHINDTVGDFTDTTFRTQAERYKNTASSSATFKIDSPNGGEVYPYLSSVSIRWSSKDASSSAKKSSNELPETVAIALHINNQFLGFLETDAPDNGTYTWTPSNTLPQEFIKSENSFKIEIERTDPVSKRKEKVISAGPFIFTLNTSTSAQLLNKASLTSDRTDVNADTVRDFKDASFILSNYYAPVTERNLRADFNNDRIINAIDLWYLKQTFNP